ncbi:hypothetical protein FRC09_001103 [Ceratobasidium sp. 395]|nr:hypothetical protein FRC09_001103 [Ceratobasidium sp. 395]
MDTPADQPVINSAAKPTIEPDKSAAEPTVELAAEPNAASPATAPASSPLAPNPNSVITDPSSPPEAPSSPTILPTDPVPVLRVSLRKRSAKNDPPAPPALPADSNAATPKDNAAADAPLASPKLTPVTPFISTQADTGDSDIIWRGIAIAPVEMAAIRSSAAHQAKGGRPLRMAPMFDELVAIFAANPDYDPSSDPHPPPEPPAPVKGRRGRGTPAAVVAAGPPVSVEAAPLAEDPKAQPKPKQKAKPKPKMRPVPDPEPEHNIEPGPEPAGNDHTAANTVPGENYADYMELETPGDEGTGGKKGQGSQRAAKGGTKATSKAAATETKAPKATEGTKAAAVPVRVSTRTTRSNATK